jgi:acetyl coenzyme A synthetase (ADP forming)-like protein
VTSYPSEYELDVVIRDGDVVHIRPVRPDDADRHRAFMALLGRESRFFRFFQVKEALTDEETEYFVNVDYHDRMALVVLDGDKMIAVGRYDRNTDAPDTAQVAFAVADEYQSRGIGTALLQLLTAHARQHDIGRFTADVLAENVRMIRVFRNAGYELTRTLDQGVYAVDFPVEYTEGARAATEEREKRAVAASVLPLFFPGSIAVVGASTRRGAIGNTLFKNLISTGFNGPVYPVNPSARVVESVRAYPSVLHIPERIDLAFIVVPSAHVIDAVRQCGEAGVRGVVVISAGFGEVGNTDMEAELLDVVRSHGMRMVGPNCMGLLNTSETINMNGTFAPVYPPRGNIAMSSQSGALGIAILEFARRNALGISQFISVGNKADIVGSDLLALWEDDPQTDVILFYLESFGGPRRFTRLARRVARKKPIIAVKSGRTGAGSRAASSHTGALASRDIAVDALFEEAGVMRVDTLEGMFGLASLLANQPVPKGRRVGIVTNAGGPAILAADALEGRGLELPALSDELRAQIGAHLPAEASTANPIDMIAGAGPDEYRASLEGLLHSGEVDTVMVLYVPTSAGGEKAIGRVVREVAEAYEGDTTLVAVFMQVAEASEYLRGESTTVPVYQFPEDAAVALEKAVRYGDWLQADPGEVPKMDRIENDKAKRLMAKAMRRLGPDGGWLDPGEVTELLGLHGIRVPKEAIATSEDEAVAAAVQIGGPVVLKVIAESALHKSDSGGIALDLEGEDEVREAYRKVSTAVDDVDGVLVQEMIRGGHEVLVGVTEDPNFGPLIVYGLGGIMVEVMQDVTFKLWPITDVDASEMVDGIRGAKLLRGYRNLPEGDVGGVEDILLRVSAMVGICPEIVEMDLNPVKVLEPGHGVVAVDARIRVRRADPGAAIELADLPAVVNTRLPRTAE